MVTDNWRYGIANFTEKQLEYGLDSVLAPFWMPENVRKFYIEIWETLFGNREFKINKDEVFKDVSSTDLTINQYIDKIQGKTV